MTTPTKEQQLDVLHRVLVGLDFAPDLEQATEDISVITHIRDQIASTRSREEIEREMALIDIFTLEDLIAWNRGHETPPIQPGFEAGAAEAIHSLPYRDGDKVSFGDKAYRMDSWCGTVTYSGKFGPFYVDLTIPPPGTSDSWKGYPWPTFYVRLNLKPAPKRTDLVTVSREFLTDQRKQWLANNDPKDGTDCVTPFDEFLYSDDRQ